MRESRLARTAVCQAYRPTRTCVIIRNADVDSRARLSVNGRSNRGRSCESECLACASLLRRSLRKRAARRDKGTVRGSQLAAEARPTTPTGERRTTLRLRRATGRRKRFSPAKTVRSKYWSKHARVRRCRCPRDREMVSKIATRPRHRILTFNATDDSVVVCGVA